MQLRRSKHLLLGGLLLALWACGRAEDSKKMDDVVARLERIEKKLDNVPSRPQLPPRPTEPDTKAVYAVPVEGDPFVGPAAAKVTLVEASDFA